MNSSSNYSFHRPIPSRSTGTALSPIDKPGRALLQLLRSRDKLLLGKTTSKKSHHDDGDYEEKAGDNDISENEIIQVEDELLSLLSSVNESIRRCGLFGNDVEKATTFYNCAAERSSSLSSASSATSAPVDNNTDGTKKRKRKKGVGGGGVGSSSDGGGGLAGSLPASSYGIYLDSINSKDTSYNSSMGGGEKKYDLDEGLILTAVCKILGVHVGRRKKVGDGEDIGVGDETNNNDDLTNLCGGNASSSHFYGPSISCAALSVLSSLCDHAKDGMIPSLNGNSTFASIEGDMIGSIGTPLMDALHENIVYWYSYYTNCQQEEERMVLNVLTGSFRSCASVVCLLGTRLSRADKTMQSIKETSWMVLNNMPTEFANHNNMTGSNIHDKSPMHDGVRNAATALLASLALAGNSEGVPPSKIWSLSVANAILMLRWAIHDIFPMPNATSPNNKSVGEGSRQQHQNTTVWKDHTNWIALARDVTPHDGELDLGKDATSNHRSRAVLSRIQCLTRYIRSLLRMEGYPLYRLPNNMPSLAIHLPLDSLLDISEILLSFSLAAEAKHRSTKSRLRDTPVADGLLSPNGAVEIAPVVRFCGHDLLNIVVESCRGGSGVRGRARRVVSIALATLQSSCSSVLVSVVDGSLRSGGVGDGSSRVSRMGSWLRGSIPLRIESIRTFHGIAISLGSGIMSSTGTSKSVSRALILLGGCLLEQVNDSDEQQQVIGVDDEWGTIGERAKLVETATNALAACIASFGGLIPNNVRGTLDSITHACFSKMYSSGNSSILSYSHVKRAMLQLGMNCVCVPWQDGGRSTTSNIVRTVSEMLRNDPDVSVASTALSSLCVFDAFATPRAPPMLVPTRGSMDERGCHGTSLTASSLIVSVNESKWGMMISKDAANERRINKSDKRSSKIAKEETDKPEIVVQLNLSGGIVDGVAGTVQEAAEENIGNKAFESLNCSTDTDPNVEEPSAISAATAFQNHTVQQVEQQNDEVGEVTMSECRRDSKKQIEGVVEVTMSECQRDSQKGVRDDHCDANAKTNYDESSDDSMDDFPEIVDEDPDEEDRINN